MMASCRGKRRDLVHKFPMDNERAEQWRQIINYPELHDLSLSFIRRRMFVCTKHFRPNDYTNSESRNLNKTALPSLLLEADPFLTSPIDPNQTCTLTLGDYHAAPMHTDDEEDANKNSEMLRFEIEFDSVEVLNPSELRAEAGSTVYLEASDELLGNGNISILEPNKNQHTSTYTLLNAPVSKQKFRHNAMKNTTNKDEDTEEDSGKVVVMSLSSENFLHLQNQLLMQKKLQEPSQIIVQTKANTEVLSDCRNSEHGDELSVLGEILMVAERDHPDGDLGESADGFFEQHNMSGKFLIINSF